MIQCRRYLAASYVFVVVSRIRCSVAGMLHCHWCVCMYATVPRERCSVAGMLQCRVHVAAPRVCRNILGEYHAGYSLRCCSAANTLQCRNSENTRQQQIGTLGVCLGDSERWTRSLRQLSVEACHRSPLLSVIQQASRHNDCFGARCGETSRRVARHGLRHHIGV